MQVTMSEDEFWDIFVAIENSVGINSTGEIDDVLTLQDRAYEVIKEISTRHGLK